MVGDSLCVIPGRLTVGQTGGTFAKLETNPFKEGPFADTEESRKQPVVHDVAARTKASIVRI